MINNEQPEEEDVEDEDEDIAKLLEPLSRYHLVLLLRSAATSNPATLAEIHRLADLNPSHRKIFIHRLVGVFLRFGEIEEGPLGFDRKTGKPKGFALFIYRTVEGAKKALEEPNKNFEGQNLYCQRASDGHKHKASAPSPQNSLVDAGFGGNTGYNVQGGGVYGGIPSSAAYNGAVDMSMSQGMMGGGPMQFGQGMQQANAALAMLAAAGQNPAAFGVPPALIASFNPALAAAMTGGNPHMAMQNTMTPPGYGVAYSGYQSVGYQGPSPSVNQGSNT